MESSAISEDSYLQYITEEQMSKWETIYNDLIEGFTIQIGKNTSKKERDSLHLTDSTLVYGEISFSSFVYALLKIKFKYGLPNMNHTSLLGVMQHDNGTFVDLGSGTGKAVIAASIVHNFSTTYGIEILEGLHTLAIDLVANFNSRGKSKLESIDQPSHTNCSVYHGDMLNLQYKDWRSADVVFANSTCYDDTLMLKIADIAQVMKKGSFFITFTRPVPGDDWEILEYGLHAMSWGLATVYIHQKRTVPR